MSPPGRQSTVCTRPTKMPRSVPSLAPPPGRTFRHLYPPPPRTVTILSMYHGHNATCTNRLVEASCLYDFAIKAELNLNRSDNCPIAAPSGSHDAYQPPPTGPEHRIFIPWSAPPAFHDWLVIGHSRSPKVTAANHTGPTKKHGTVQQRIVGNGAMVQSAKNRPNPAKARYTSTLATRHYNRPSVHTGFIANCFPTARRHIVAEFGGRPRERSHS